MTEQYVYDCECDYPGCAEPAPNRSDLTLFLRQRWLGGRVSMGIHIFSCDAHERSMKRFVELLTKEEW